MIFSKPLMKLLCGFVSAFLCMVSSAHAEKVEVNGVDLAPVIEIFKRQVRVVQKPFHIYHWGSDSSFYDRAYSATDARAAEVVRRGAQSFLQGLEAQDRLRGNNYGGGLYSAVDPLSTEVFGTYSDDWILVDSELPVGFRMLDIVEPQERRISVFEGQQALDKLGCEYDRNPEFVRSALAMRRMNPQCAQAIRLVIRTLKIDGFAYQYGGYNLRGCKRDNGVNAGPAFVFTSEDWIKSPSQIHVFTATTPDAKSEREAIENLFIFNSSHESTSFGEMHVGTHTGSMVANAGGLHWPDLAGSKIENMDLWTKQNILNCDLKDHWGPLGEL